MMAVFRFAIKKQALVDDQITLIRMYKTFLIPEDSYVEEYNHGFKFYFDELLNINNIIEFFKGYNINVIFAEFFEEEWYY